MVAVGREENALVVLVLVDAVVAGVARPVEACSAQCELEVSQRGQIAWREGEKDRHSFSEKIKVVLKGQNTSNQHSDRLC